MQIRTQLNRSIAWAILVVALGACAPEPARVAPAPAVTAAPSIAVSAATTFPMTVTDDAGRQVTLKAAPKRVVSLAPSNTELVYGVERGALLVGVTEYCDYPPQAREKTKIGGFSKIDLEKVVGLEPDLVLATDIHVKSIVPELERRGLTVVVIIPKNVNEVVARVTLVGRLLDASEIAAQKAADLQSRVQQIVTRVSAAKIKPRVFYEIDTTLYTPGPGSFIADMITQAGGINIAADAKGAYAQMTLEALVLKDPEVIILGDHVHDQTPDQVRARPSWSNITAVKNGRIVAIADENLVSRAGPRAIDGLEILARGIHPDLVK